MNMPRQTILASRPAAMVVALSLVAGLTAPFLMLPSVHAALVVPNGTIELSPAPVNQVTAVPPNIVMTFDDSGSMASAFMGDDRPFDNGSWSGRWRCAGVIDPSATSGIGAQAMNGVYYNPKVNYLPPVYANGTSFPQAGTDGGTTSFSLANVENDGVTAYRPLNASGANSTTDFTNQTSSSGTKYWQCYSDGGYTGNLGQSGNHYSTTSRVAGGGPYYYKYTGPAIAVDGYGNPTSAGLNNLYKSSNWTAVAVGASGLSTDTYQNWANWWAYYRTRNQMARTAISRAFGASALAATNADGSYGSDIRVAWQNLYTSDAFRLQDSTIISALLDASGCSASDSSSSGPGQALQSTPARTPPPCYRSAFFNWVFSVPATNNTPSRAATIRAGQFFTRGNGNTGVSGDLHDPYWQPPPQGPYTASNTGNELYCRQNFHMLITDGYSNESDPSLPSTTNNAGVAFRDVINSYTLPDGVGYSSTANVSRIYWNNRGGDYPSNMANIAFNYWATNLRPDLYVPNPTPPATAQIVPPYLPDTHTGLFPGAGNVSFRIGTNADGTPQMTTIPAEEYFNPNNDPATWPHLVQYMVTLGVSGTLNHSDDYDCTLNTAANPNDACALRTGAATSDGNVGWPMLVNNSPEGIDDLWHATLTGRGKYFNAGNPSDLVNQLSSILSSIAARSSNASPSAVNASVATVGALAFQTSYNKDWSGNFTANALNVDGNINLTPAWSAYFPAPASRNIYTAAYSGGTFSSFAFTTGNVALLDASENTPPNPTAIPPAPGRGLQSPTLSGTDTVNNRIDYLRGDATHEADGTYRSRTDATTGVRNVLGAIINSQPVYVSYPSGNYYTTWPAGSPEIGHSYDTFVSDHATRAGTVYIGANDGMLHAFNAPVPDCSTTPCTYGTNPGKEDWAFIPRAVYANLGNLTSRSDFSYRPTVDATPVTRDVFFSSDNDWHTILAGGVGLGGRGVYALDITGPSGAAAATPTTAPTKVLWELDSDMTIPNTCKSIVGTSQSGTCQASDLGYTVSQPNIGRLHTGQWAVLVPNGYFPDCSKPDYPTADFASCSAIAAQAPGNSAAKPTPYSALFVMDAETGTVLAELKTPTGLTVNGVTITSFGLATPVMGDYDNDQVDDVAFAGDLQGNLWRFDLKAASPTGWSVTLVYAGLADASGNQGLQPITTMPRLFPDPATNRFMVVFGTGKYLGAGDNSSNAVQSMMGVRDVSDTASPYSQTDLTPQYLHEATAPATLPDGSPNPNADATLRCVTGGASDTCALGSATSTTPIPAVGQPKGGGWFINLYTTTSSGVQNNSGERVVVSPGAIFASNTIVFETLLAGAQGSDPCNPATQGALMALNAVTGAPAGVSSLGGWPIIGGRISNARTSGSLPLVSALGGGQAYLPGTTLAPSGTKPLSIDAPIWRRRSWQGIQQN